MKRGWPMAAALVLAGVAGADVIHLDTGTRLEGELKRTPDGWLIRLDGGGEMQIPFDRVKRVEVQPRSGQQPGGENVAKSRLSSLQRSLESVTDPQFAIDRYQQFIDQHAETEAAKIAREELAKWRQRQEQGLVRQGDQWVTPQRAAELRNEANLQAANARSLIKAGREAEAAPQVEAVLKLDPANVSALYLKGVLAYRADQVNDAKRAWEAVAAQDKVHGPTLNNLAVIDWRQNRFVEALGRYEQAMAARPADEIILANVAEALNALPRELRDGTVAQRVYRRYVEQEQVLQKRMAEQGLYRWGNRYLTREELARIEAQEKEIQAQLDGMAERFAQLEKRIREIDLQGESNDRTLRQLEAGSWHRDVDGRLYRLPLPPVYYEVKRDNERLKAQRAETTQELERLRRTARDLQQQLPQARYSGVQNIIGVEGTPVALVGQPGGEPAADPATQPAPEPADTAPSTNPAPAATTLPTPGEPPPVPPQLDPPDASPLGS